MRRAVQTQAQPKIPKELLDQVAAGGTPMTAEQINATSMALKKALIERALGGGLSHHWPAANVRCSAEFTPIDASIGSNRAGRI